LILAEIELESETSDFNKPSWIGIDVSQSVRYYYSKLIHNPYCNW